MGKFLLISISIVALASSISAHGGIFCKVQDGGDFKICGSGDILSSVRQIKRGAGRLELNLDNFSTITPYAFQSVMCHQLELKSSDSENCVPKLIEVIPESFEELSVVGRLELECLEFPVRPNLFQHFGSVVNLRLKRVDFVRFSIEDFADFPYLFILELNDVKIANITPDMFSEINEELGQLTIIDRISSIMPRSFARFPKLECLVLNGGQLGYSLTSSTFDGLPQLKYLNLDHNGITVLHGLTFSKLPQLETLHLRGNKIRAIDAYTFVGLINLRELHLADNNLEDIFVGVFNEAPNLNYLNISSNIIRTIYFQTFKGRSKLRILDLSSNKIGKLSKNVFSGFNLEKLSLINNTVTRLVAHSFNNLHVSEVLDLRGNNITRIENHAFLGLTAGRVSLCFYRHVNRKKKVRWGIVGNSINKLDDKNCGQ